MGKVKVLRSWMSPFSRRVEIALKLKGVEYDCIEEDLQNKSELLLKSNPVHKKIPVLIHNENPISESLVILEYIDEVWTANPILPSDPYQRAQVRFWARFIDDKLAPTIVKALIGQGEESDQAVVETPELLKALENEIQEKRFFAGDSLGYVDIAAIGIAYWIPAFQEITGKKLLTRDEFPGICNWANALLDHSIIKDNLPNREKLVEMLRTRFVPKSA